MSLRSVVTRRHPGKSWALAGHSAALFLLEWLLPIPGGKADGVPIGYIWVVLLTERFPRGRNARGSFGLFGGLRNRRRRVRMGHPMSRRNLLGSRA